MITGSGQLRQLAVDIGAAQIRVGAEIAQEVRKAGEATKTTAQRLVPVDEGELKASIAVSTTGDGRSAAMAADVTAGTDHALFVEYGTSKMTPRPYMAPALAAEGPELQKAIERIVDNLL